MNSSLVRNISSVRNLLLSVAFLTICSKVTIPLYPVPITLQMFAIYFLGLLLTPRESFSAVLSWICIGAAGFPVFASSVGGIGGPTTGYLVGMLFGAPLIGFLRSKNVSSMLSCIVCCLVVLAFGCLWLANFVGFKNVIQLGVTPFVIPDLLKMTLACSIIAARIFGENA